MKNNQPKINWIKLKDNSYRGLVNNSPMFFLYESDGVWNLEGIYSDKDLNKKRLLKVAQDKINEYGLGNSFSMSGGGQRIYPGGRFGQINRGGFHNSMYGGSDNSMYTYDIIPLNSLLQQRATLNDNPEDVQIYPGETVQGKELNKDTDEWVVGVLVSIKKSDLGSQNYFLVLDSKDKVVKKVDPTTTSVYTKLHNSEIRDTLPTIDIDFVDKDNKIATVKEELDHYITPDVKIILE